MLFRELTMEEFADIRAREAYSDGVAEGFERGAAQKEREIAKKLKDSGISPDIIAANTGLSMDEIRNL